ncbi:MAG: molybdenum cofactor guanylyltransferase [Planctomycetota bacterium]|jgi:molybdopterin-guanine dinucleotide biosynthesis protein A
MLKNKMIKLDGMLMIGSAGANVGKTELACALIKKIGKTTDITGIKVTTIRAKDGQCPRGGQGCGVCTSVDGDFDIMEEIDSNSQKDTARLLAAGAKRVFWLRVMKKRLEEGLTCLLDIIGPDAVSICESNSLRQVVEPGLFLMVRGRDSKKWKSSARDVKKYADRIIVSGPHGFDYDLNRIKLMSGKWALQEQATAIIMAGGGSRRMGIDKSMLLIKDKPIIKYICDQLRGTFSQILISTDDVEKYAFLGFDCIRDKIPGEGPLMGIASTLEASANELNFVVACDIPHIDIRLVRKMLAEAHAADMVIPTTGGEKYEPLFAVYCKSSLEAINEMLKSGTRKISDAFARCKVKYIKLKAEQLTNLNTMAEYEEFREKYDAKV